MQKSYLVPGIQSVATLVQHAPERILELFIEEGCKNDRILAIASSCSQQGISQQSIQQERLTRLCDGVQHQGVAARCTNQPLLTETDLQKIVASVPAPLLLALDEVSDPHNLGACLRSAEAAGANAIIVTNHNSASVTAVVRKVSCGASELLPIVLVSNLARCIEQLKKTGIWVIGASAEAKQPIYDCDLVRPTLLVMGAEGTGLRRLTEQHCDLLARLPIIGGVESLNVSVATGICLYEALRQRQA